MLRYSSFCRSALQIFSSHGIIASSIHGSRQNVRNFWSKVEMGPPDNIFGLVEAFKKCDAPEKVNLSIGVYRDNDGNHFVLPTVRKAEKLIEYKQMDKEYAGMVGYADFCNEAAKLTFGENHSVLARKANATLQSISGTGALSLVANFISRFHTTKVIYHSNPTWGNHAQIFRLAGLEARHYTYYHPETCGLNLEGMLHDLKEIPNGSCVLLQASAHNPTGVDPNQAQWKQIAEVFREKSHLPFFDMAYQGFATGDLEKDAYPVRLFAEMGLLPIVTQSFAKNMGLYGERTGAVHFITSSIEEKERVMSQLKILVRATYSNPPIHGARIAVELLTKPELHQAWLDELKLMSGRIFQMRDLLQKRLKNFTKMEWSHVTNQIGMFCYSGLTLAQVESLKNDYSIFMTKDGRISMVAVTTKNVDYIAESIAKVINCK